MKLYNLNLKDKTANIDLESDEESQLIAESIDLLIQKQEKTVKIEKNDSEEVQKLEKYKKTKFLSVDVPKIKKQKEKKMLEKVKRIKDMKEGGNKDDNNNNNNNNNNKDNKDKIPDDVDDNNNNIFISESDSKVHHKNVYDLVNAVNEHIVLLEANQTFRNTNKDKYIKLQNLLENIQRNKALFEQRVTPKPRGFGRLRK